MTDDRHAWARNGIEQVSSTIHRIPLQMPGDALEAVNVYLIEGPEGVGLVDSGWLSDDALTDLEHALADLGHTFEDLGVVLATHYHPDHYTLGIELRRRTGVPLYLGAPERRSLEVMASADRGIGAFGARLVRAGVPSTFVGKYLIPNPASHLFEMPDHWIGDGDHPAVGGRPLEAVATPGHTRGHVSFVDNEAGLFFAGDHVLPHITPSIGFEATSDHQPLADFLDSLTKVLRRPDAVLLPAHGPITPSVHTRALELIAHHDDRLQRCEVAIDLGARTAYEVAQRIPWTRRERQLSELSALDQLMAVHETVAHLVVLELQGRVTVLVGDDVDEYVTV